MRKEIEKKLITFGVHHFAPTIGMVVVVCLVGIFGAK